MTSSELQNAQKLLDVLATALDPRRVTDTIEAPLDAAAERLLIDVPRPSSYREFNQRICEFAQQVYAAVHRVLSRDEAFAITVQSLDEAYGSASRRGYEFALLDVVQDGCQEMQTVLQSILAAIKARAKHNHAAWVCALHLEPLDWNGRCALAAAILQSHKQLCGQELFPGDPTRFAADLGDLLSAHLETVQTIQALTAPPVQPQRGVKF